MSIRASPRVASIYLVKFDVRKGNTIVWSKSKPGCAHPTPGLEFRAIPSGLHSAREDVIYFVQPQDKGNELYEGIAVFQQNDLVYGSQRRRMEMYSLAVLCTTDSNSNSTNITTSSNSNNHNLLQSQGTTTAVEEETKGWVYTDTLKQLLSDFLLSNMSDSDSTTKFAPFEHFFDKYASDSDILPAIELPEHHPISAVRPMLVTYGPLIFEIWKAVMLRCRVVLHDADTTTQVEQMCQFVYVLSVLASIPSDISHLVPPQLPQLGTSYQQSTSSPLYQQQQQQQHHHHHHHHNHKETSVNAYYNISLPDAEWLGSQARQSEPFVATTRDSVLLDKKKKLYDMAVITNNGHTRLEYFTDSVSNTSSASSTSDNSSTTETSVRYATGRSRRRFQVLVEALGINDSIPSNSSYSNLLGDRIGGVVDSISSLCSQAAINGFLWWASAGEQSNDETEQDTEGLPFIRRWYRQIDNEAITETSEEPLLNDDQHQRGENSPSGGRDHSEQNVETTSTDLSNGSSESSSSPPLEITVIGYFHQMTRRLFQTMASLIQAQDYENGGVGGDPVTLDPSDIRRMGLDAYSNQDAEFAIQFVKVWWNRDVKLVSPCLGKCCQL